MVAIARQPGRPASFVEKHWPDDRRALTLINRAAVDPGSTTGWGAELATTSAVADLVTPVLGPPSAAAELLRRALVLPLGREADLYVPGVAAAASLVSFTAEADPLPVNQLSVGGANLTPFKLGSIFVFTAKAFEHSTPTLEALTRAVVSESLALGLESILLDANAASTIRPAGLRNGVAAIPATAGGTIDALRKDIGNLVAAVGAIGGSNLLFVAAPDVAAKLALAQPDLKLPVVASGALASGTLLCMAPAALAVAVDPVPLIELSQDATVPLDTQPLALATVGEPNTIAAPSVSFFQQNLTGIRFIVNATWGWRSSGGIAWTETVTW
jgi:hypothetical protein